MSAQNSPAGTVLEVRWGYAALALIFFLLALGAYYLGWLVANSESYTTWSNSGARTFVIAAIAFGLFSAGSLVVGFLRR